MVARQLVSTYDYTDESGQVLYQKLRFEPKDFRTRRPDGMGGWLWNLDGVRRVLYRLPDLMREPRDRLVWVVEGEKDADALTALGQVATTNDGGAGKWLAELNGPLRGRYVCVIPDNDPPGREHARQVAQSLKGVAASVCIVSLPGLPAKGDVSDWLAAGGDAEQLLRLAQQAPPAASSGEKTPPEPLFQRLSGVRSEPVSWLWRGWLPAGTLSMLDGDPGLGKSTLTLDLAARVSRGWRMPPEGGRDPEREPAHVLLLGAEDSLKHTVRPRLDAAGADPDLVTSLDGFRVNEKEVRDPVLPWDLRLLAGWIKENGVGLVIVDPLMAFLGGEYDAHKDQDIRRCMRPLRDLAEELGISILLLRHLNKLSGGPALYRGGGSIGMIGAARASLVVGRDPQEPKRHVLAMNKLNLGPMPTSLSYFIEPVEDVARIAWEGTTTLGRDDILWHATTKPPAADKTTSDSARADAEAESFLLQVLAKGPIAISTLQTDAKAINVNWSTVQKARAKLGIKTQKVGSVLLWELPDD